MLGTLHAERVQIEETEDGFVLHIRTHEIGTILVNVQAVAFELERAVYTEIRPYVLEGEHVVAYALPPEAPDDFRGEYEPGSFKDGGYVAALELHADTLDAAERMLRGDA